MLKKGEMRRTILGRNKNVWVLFHIYIVKVQKTRKNSNMRKHPLRKGEQND